jgi:multiple sugar transport system ATP-binding protein
MSSVSIRSLDVVLGKNRIIENLDLDIEEGEFVVLLGPSGCGKSTLLHSIAGLIDVSDGRIDIAGTDVTWADPKDRGIGMVFQSYALYPTMTVERNLSFGLRISGMPKADIKARIDNAARMLQLTELLQRKPAQLSGGQRQRVAIGRALVRQAKVFLLDEPLSNLDAKLRAELRRELKQLHQDLGATMVHVTHDQIEAMTLATRIAVMRSGKIQQFDTPDRVYAQPSNMFVAGFLGSPSMNFVHGHLRREGERVRFESAVLRVDVSGYAFVQPPTEGQAVVLGIRPEHLRSANADTTHNAQATVSLIEPMGANKIAWLDAQGTPLAMQVEPMATLVLGAPIRLAFDATHVSLFDAANEQRL